MIGPQRLYSSWSVCKTRRQCYSTKDSGDNTSPDSPSSIENKETTPDVTTYVKGINNSELL